MCRISGTRNNNLTLVFISDPRIQDLQPKYITLNNLAPCLRAWVQELDQHGIESPVLPLRLAEKPPASYLTSNFVSSATKYGP